MSIGLIDKYRSYLKSSFYYLLASFMSAIIGVVIFPFQSQYMNHEDFAIVGYFTSFSQLLGPIVNFSLISYYSRNYFQIKDTERDGVLNVVLWGLNLWGIISTVLLCVSFYFFLEYSNTNFTFWPYAVIALLPYYFNNFYTIYQVKCRMERQAKKFFYFTSVHTILVPIFTVLFVIIFRMGAEGKLIALLMPTLIMGIYAFKRLYNTELPKWNKSILSKAFHFGWPLSLSTMLWYFAGGVDRYFLASVNDTYNLGLYNIGLQISGYMAIFITVLMQTFEPDIYKAIADNNQKRIWKLGLLIVASNAIINMLFILICPYVIDLLTYHKFTASAEFTQIVTLKNVSISLYFVINTIIIGYGYTKSSLMIRAISAIICYFMYKLLIDNYGFYGAAYGQVLSFVIMTLVAIVFLFFLSYKKKKVQCSNMK